MFNGQRRLKMRRKMGPTEELADFVTESTFETFPPEAVTLATRSILDDLGNALGGSVEPAGKMITEFAREMAPQPQASIIGGGVKTALPCAALANGTLMHALDWDDFTLSTMHPTTAVLPAVLALGEHLALSGRQVLEAYLVGLEVCLRIALGLTPELHIRGWHPTATLGSFGAAAACASILKLAPHQTRMAFGLAICQSAGMKANFGTMGKPFQAGNVSRAGLVAALLAKKGFTAAPNVLEEQYGVHDLFIYAGQEKTDLRRITTGLSQSFEIVTGGIGIKPYPVGACYVTTIDASLAIFRRHHPKPEEIETIDCIVSPVIPIINHPQPKTALDSRFSYEYCTVIALIDGKAGIRQFSDERFKDPQVQSLLQKVKLHVDPRLGEGWPTTVTVTMKNGQQYSERVDIGWGQPGNPMSWEDLVDKFRECAEPVLAREKVDRSLELLGDLEKIGAIGELMDIIV
jgi:2-methylcitrate dehydratase PrpD